MTRSPPGKAGTFDERVSALVAPAGCSSGAAASTIQDCETIVHSSATAERLTSLSKVLVRCGAGRSSRQEPQTIARILSPDCSEVRWSGWLRRRSGETIGAMRGPPIDRSQARGFKPRPVMDAMGDGLPRLPAVYSGAG